MCFPLILLIHPIGRLSEIADPVVTLVSIDMVNRVFRPNTMNKQPSKAMRKVSF